TDKAHVAAIVKLVIQLAKENDSTATQILINAGEELGEMTLRAIKQSGLKENIKIGISGNIIRKIEIVKANFIKYLDMNLGNYSIYDEDISPTLGAYYEVINMNI
ncbi:ATPase family protein, partial [human gut metagenome]